MKKIPFVDLKLQYQNMKEEIDRTIKRVIENTSFIGGPDVNKFSVSLATLMQTKHAIPVANGTDAIYIALKMLGIGEGDEVITSAHSWISTSETISQTGAKPIFVDTNEFFCIDSKLIESKITKKTKAIIPVHLFGNSCDMTAIKKIASKYNLLIIEDCAQAILTKWKGRLVGTFGSAGTISFFPGKNLGAYGDAGGIITNQTNLFKKMKMFANHGGLVKHQHEIEGINSRMDGLQAAILDVKIQYIEKWIDQRRSAAEMYNYHLADISELALPKVHKNTFHSYHLYVVEAANRDKLAKYLNGINIATGIHYPKPLPALECYKSHKLDLEDFPRAVSSAKSILSLPMFPEITEEQVKYVSSAIKAHYLK
tara:strand:+ start:5760 stop:6866 length:1107 start_codon:yes stop_codon:yes gene_type:complete